jgi:tetratricopeptide (TPR) repeat protein
LHSRDQGETWDFLPTHQPLPLNGVFFRDEKRGWAVGELGTILATADGGQTWQVRHHGGKRAAVLMVHARAAGMPVDTVALLGGQEGYLTAALRVTGSEAATAAPARAADAARFAAAVRQAGGAAGEMLWQFPISSHLARADRQELVKAWDQLHGGRAAVQLLRQLVLAIRVWRPEVILTDNPDPATAGAADALLAEALHEAFDRAADPKAFPEQIGQLGLQPWKASKLYGRWEGRTEGQVSLDLTAVSPALQASVREFAGGAALLLAGGPVPARRNYRLLADHLTGAAAHADLMQGTNAPEGEARRPAAVAARPTPEALKALRQRAALRALSESPSALANPDRLLAQIGPMLDDMPDDQAAHAAHAAASQYVRMGQWALAREAFLLMVERYPAHPLTADALLWLLRHNASSEARRRHELGQFLVVGQQEFGVPHKGGHAVNPPDEGLTPARRTRVGEMTNVTMREKKDLVFLADQDKDRTEARKWYEGSLALEPKLAAFGPLFADDPSVQFCLQAARRNLGDFETPRKWYAQFMARQPDGPWRQAAAAELWLADRSGPPPKPLAACRHTDSRPYLDGKLDDPCWQEGQPLRLHNADPTVRHGGDPRKEADDDPLLKDYPTEVRFAYDNEYLYVAVRCFHSTGKQVPPVKGRSHDADLRGHDRVSLLLDLDRDYATCFHLQIDQRGCVAEDCWGDKTWDPRWFVAVTSEARVWVAEAAIPLAALTGDSVTPGRAWACNVVRVLPGRGVQAWSLPAEVPEEALRPEGMGLLLFTHDTGRAPVEGSWL